MASLHDELEGLLRTYETAWRGGNYDALRALWDSDEREPIYVPEESAPLIGWTAIDAYFAGNQKVLANVAVRTWDHHVRAVGEDVAILFYQMHWNAKIVDGSLMGGDVRAGAPHRSGVAVLPLRRGALGGYGANARHAARQL
ncbi:MAG: hypothetical protein HQ495_13160 [Alphaproteobacteria bacterium]|nr:hypothetical protein [Alphaproteobacteria bacterium]